MGGFRTRANRDQEEYVRALEAENRVLRAALVNRHGCCKKCRARQDTKSIAQSLLPLLPRSQEESRAYHWLREDMTTEAASNDD